MLYTCSLVMPTKKALGANKCYQSSLAAVIRQLQIDPATSNMDAVLLGPGDLSGNNKKKFLDAIANGIHPGICLMYIYTKESEATGINIPYMKGVAKIKPADIQKFVQESMEDFMNKSGQLEVDPGVFTETSTEEEMNPVATSNTSEIEQDLTTFVPQMETPKVDVPQMSFEQPMEEELPPVDISVVRESVPEPTPTPVAEPVPAETYAPVSKREEALNNIKSFEDWNLLKEALDRDSITKELMQENAEYLGTIQMLEVLDKRIQSIYFDNSLSADKKFEEIKKVASDKTELRAVTNTITAQRVISIIDTVVTCATRLVEEKLSNVNDALAKMTVTKDQMMDTSELDEAISARLDIHMELLDTVMRIIKIYSQANDLATEEIKDYGSGIPSSNPFINNMLKPLDASMFTPTNTSKLANDVLKSLQDGTLKLSAIEDEVQSTIRLLCTAFETDDDIQKYQLNLINMLKAQRVEDVVVKDNILKYVLHVYTGAEDTGRTSTVLTWSGIQSKRGNTLLIDLTGTAHYERYGYTPIELNEFLSKRLEQEFVVVQSKRKLEPEELAQLVSEVKTRLNYYKTVNVVVSPEDKEAFDLVASQALTLNYITDCSLRSIDTIKSCISVTNLDNVARKVIMIDAPISPLRLTETLEIDPTLCKIVMIPYMKAMKACALKQDRPYEHNDIVTIFEEAFR